MAEVYEKLAEAVRQFPVLYDKACHDFKDRNKKRLAWVDVAKQVGFDSGNEAKTVFTNLRNRYSRDRKKLKKAKVSGSGSDGVSKVKEEVEDMFVYLAWLDPYYKPRKTANNYINVESENEESDDDEDPNEDNISEVTDTSMVSSHDGDNLSSNNFRPKKKAKLHSRTTREKMNQDFAATEIEVLKSIGATLGQNQKSLHSKDEDELFGALIASQLRQIAPDRKVMVKMQVSNILYQELLASFTTTPVPYTGDQTWRYPQHPQHPQQPQQQHSTLENSDRNKSLRRSFQIPNMLQSEEEPLHKPGQLFYRNQTNQSQMGFLDDLNDNI